MSATITIQLPPASIDLLNKWKGAPERSVDAIKRGMDRALEVVSGRIQLTRLTGHGPFPVELHRLGERTGQLKLRTRSVEAVVSNTGDNQSTVTGAIGSSVKYAAYHEFGTKTLPERAPFRTGIKENASYISETISREIAAALK